MLDFVSLIFEICRDQQEPCERFTQGLGYSNLTDIPKECGDLLVQSVTQRLRDGWRKLWGRVTLERISVKRNPPGEMLTYRPDEPIHNTCITCNNSNSSSDYDNK